MIQQMVLGGVISLSSFVVFFVIFKLISDKFWR